MNSSSSFKEKIPQPNFCPSTPVQVSAFLSWVQTCIFGSQSDRSGAYVQFEQCIVNSVGDMSLKPIIPFFTKSIIALNGKENSQN